MCLSVNLYVHTHIFSKPFTILICCPQKRALSLGRGPACDSNASARQQRPTVFFQSLDHRQSTCVPTEHKSLTHHTLNICMCGCLSSFCLPYSTISFFCVFPFSLVVQLHLSLSTRDQIDIHLLIKLAVRMFVCE